MHARTGAILTHLFTASGAAVCVLAALAAAEGDGVRCFTFLGIAFIIDGLDGPLARRTRPWETLPRFSGERLDFIIDYLSYVFIPAIYVYTAGLVPEPFALATSMLICVTALYHFSDTSHKTGDFYFVGFPAVWNVAVFYLAVFAVPPWAALLVIAGLIALTFVPVKFIHPFRVRVMRSLSIAVTVIWAACAIAAVVHNLAPPAWAAWGLALSAVYFAGFGLVRSTRSED